MRLAEHFRHLEQQCKDIVDLIPEVFGAELEWTTINLEIIADAVTKHGTSIRDSDLRFLTCLGIALTAAG